MGVLSTLGALERRGGPYAALLRNRLSATGRKKAHGRKILLLAAGTGRPLIASLGRLESVLPVLRSLALSVHVLGARNCVALTLHLYREQKHRIGTQDANLFIAAFIYPHHGNRKMRRFGRKKFRPSYIHTPAMAFSATKRQISVAFTYPHHGETSFPTWAATFSITFIYAHHGAFGKWTCRLCVLPTIANMRAIEINLAGRAVGRRRRA